MSLLLLFLLWMTGAGLVLLLRPLSLRGLAGATPMLIGLGAAAQHGFFLLACWAGPVQYWMYLLLPVAVTVAWGMRGGCSVDLLPARYAPLRLNALAAGALVLLLTIQMLLLFPSLGLPLFDWDARILWALKARHLAEQPTLHTEFFRDPFVLHIHPRYPLLVPWLTSVLAQLDGGFAEWQFRAVVLTGGFLSVWQLFLTLLRRNGLVLAWSAGLVLVLTGAWLNAGINAQVEMVLVFYLLTAVDRIAVWFEKRQSADLFLASVLFAGGAMVKNEGLLLLVCTGVALLLVAPSCSFVRRLSVVAAFFGMALVVLLPWLVQRAAIPAVADEQYATRLGLTFFAVAWTRLPEIGSAMAVHMSEWRVWQLFWPLAGVLCAGLVWRWRRLGPWPKLLLLLWWGYLLGVIAVYGISPWRDIGLQIEVTFHRVMLLLLPIGLLLLGVFVPPHEGVACDD